MPRTFLILTLPCLMWSCCFGQSSPSTPEPNPTSPAEAPLISEQDVAAAERPKRDAFYSLARRANQIKVEMDNLIGSMPVGFPKLQEEQLAKLEALKKERIELNPQIMAAAIDAFREAPTEDTNVSMTVLNVLSASLNPKSREQRFDPKLALEIATSFLNHDIESNQKIPLYYAAFRAAYALQEFETARKMLDDGIAISSPDAKLDEKYYEKLTATEQSWNKELEIRNSEEAADDLPRVKFETTSGDFEVELFENHAPNTVANFINLVEKGFYDGLIFYGVSPGVVSQSGCPKGDGTGDPGYKIACECYVDDFRRHFTGSVSMSHNGRDTAGSQFFITHQTMPGLDGKYTAFGRVLGSMEPIFNMKMIDKTRFDPNSPEPTVINKVTVIRKRDHDYIPNTVPAEGASDSTPPEEGEGKF